jgi:hypothetical protein
LTVHKEAVLGNNCVSAGKASLIIMKDTERSVGNYLIALGVLSIIGMILSNFVFKYMRIDPLGLLLIWAGIMLRRHNQLTKKLVTVICSLLAVLVPILTLTLLFSRVGIVGIQFIGYPLHNPPKWLTILMMILVVSVYFAVPVLLLRKGRPDAQAA